MNWKVVFQASLFGLAMGVATVFLIPSRIEPLFWLVVFVATAYFLAKRCANRFFLHGVLVGLANSVWSRPRTSCCSIDTSPAIPRKPR